MEAQAETVQAQAPDRKTLRAAALEKAIAATSGEGTVTKDSMAEALRDMVSAFSPTTKASAGPRVLLEKADPVEVKAYFDGTGLNRKELAAAADVSTSVIATVQNPAGDRWSTKTFELKRGMIDQWIKDHADELKTRRANEAAEAQAKIDAAAAKVAARAKRDADRAAAAQAKADAAKAKAQAATPPTSLPKAKGAAKAPKAGKTPAAVAAQG